MPLHVSSTRAHRQEAKIVLYNLWYRHTYRCDDTRSCIVQFWPPDDEHVCSIYYYYPVGLFITDMLYILYTLPIIKNKFW